MDTQKMIIMNCTFRTENLEKKYKGVLLVWVLQFGCKCKVVKKGREHPEPNHSCPSTRQVVITTTRGLQYNYLISSFRVEP